MDDAESVDKLPRNMPVEQRELLCEFRRLPRREADGWSYVVTGEGSPVVLLPGGFMRSDMWFAVADRLGTTHRLLIPDSFVVQGIYDFAEVTDRIEAMLAHEKLEHAAFVGVSSGGGVLQYLLSERPALATRAVLSHTGLFDSSRAEGLERSVRGSQRIPGFLLKRSLRARSLRGHRNTPWSATARYLVEDAAKRITKDRFISWMEGTLASLETFHDRPYDGPVLLLASRDDPIGRPVIGRLESRYRDVETHLFDRGGHHTLFLFPDEYTSALNGFL